MSFSSNTSISSAWISIFNLGCVGSSASFKAFGVYSRGDDVESTSSLGAGNYSGSIIITAEGAGGSPKQIQVSLEVKEADSLGMNFKWIPAGSFMMGSPSDEGGRSSKETQHEVTLSQGYYIQTTEVTQGQWESVMGINPSYFSSCGSDCPVEQVSWEDVQEFIDRMNQRGEGTYKLPTEAQWEYAARAGSSSAFANGGITVTDYSCDNDSNLDAMGWHCGNSDSKTHSVAQKNANGWGLYDMHGNVWEWCQDWYDGDYYDSGSMTDPVGPSTGSYRVRRGGSWGDHARNCRSAFRHDYGPGGRRSILGFRLVRLP